MKNQQHPTYGLGKVLTTGGSDNTARRTEEYHRTGEMGGEWVRAAGWGGVAYSMALCSCGRMAPCGGMGGCGRGRGDARPRFAKDLVFFCRSRGRGGARSRRNDPKSIDFLFFPYERSHFFSKRFAYKTSKKNYELRIRTRNATEANMIT